MFCMVITPNGSTSEFTDRQLQKAERIVAALPEVTSYGAMVAPGFSGPGQANFGIVFVTFKDKSQRNRSVQEIVYGPGGVAQRFFIEVEGGMAIANLPKAIEISFRDSPFELILQNQDLDALNKIAQDMANKIRGMNNLRNVRVTFEVDKPEFRVAIDRNRAASLGREHRRYFAHDADPLWRTGPEPHQSRRQRVLSSWRSSNVNRASRRRISTKIFVRNNKGELIQLSSLVTQLRAPRLMRSTITDGCGAPASPPRRGAFPIGTVVNQVEAMLARELPSGHSFTPGAGTPGICATPARRCGGCLGWQRSSST